MSTPAESGAAEGDRRMSLGKYVKRMSSVFKREKSSKSGGSRVPDAPVVIVAEEQNTKEEAADEEGAPASPPATAEQPAPLTPTTNSPKARNPETKMIDRHAMQQERARALFAKYGLTLDSHDWIAGPALVPTVQRVEKSIRMRVHRSCHHCGTIYGAEKVCLHCEHKRCNKCPRYPRKKLAAEKEKGKGTDEKPKKKRVLPFTTRAGNELADQPPKQSVRRSCHKCEAVFAPSTATICDQCRHILCTKCPREPTKLQKWPVGYAGDAEADSDSEAEKQIEKFRRTWRKPRSRVRWECENCHGAFIHGSPSCPGCGHLRCDKCTRSPTKKTKDETFDPQLVAAVEAKLRYLDVDTDALYSDFEAAR